MLWAALCVACWFLPWWWVAVAIALFAVGEAPGVYYGNERSLSSKFWVAIGYGKYADRKPWAYAAIVYLASMTLGAGLAVLGYDSTWCRIMALVGVLLGVGDWLWSHWARHYGKAG